MSWVTNDPVAARKLHTIDRKYEAARRRIAEMNLPLEAKLKAYAAAREARNVAYDAVLEHTQ